METVGNCNVVLDAGVLSMIGSQLHDDDSSVPTLRSMDHWFVLGQLCKDGEPLAENEDAPESGESRGKKVEDGDDNDGEEDSDDDGSEFDDSDDDSVEDDDMEDNSEESDDSEDDDDSDDDDDDNDDDMDSEDEESGSDDD